MLVDEFWIGVIVNEIFNEEMMVGILALSLHHVPLLQTHIQLFIDFDYRLADAAYAFASVLQDVAAKEDCASYLALLAMHIHFSLSVLLQKAMYIIDGLQQIEEGRVSVKLIAEMVRLSPSRHLTQLVNKPTVISVLAEVPQLILLLGYVRCQYLEMMSLWVVNMVQSINHFRNGVLVLDGMLEFVIVISDVGDQFVVGYFGPDVQAEHSLL